MNEGLFSKRSVESLGRVLRPLTAGRQSRAGFQGFGPGFIWGCGIRVLGFVLRVYFRVHLSGMDFVRSFRDLPLIFALKSRYGPFVIGFAVACS